MLEVPLQIHVATLLVLCKHFQISTTISKFFCYSNDNCSSAIFFDCPDTCWSGSGINVTSTIFERISHYTLYITFQMNMLPSRVEEGLKPLLCLQPIWCWFFSCLAYSSTLKMEVTCSSKIPLYFRRTIQWYISEDKILHFITPFMNYELFYAFLCGRIHMCVGKNLFYCVHSTYNRDIAISMSCTIQYS